jgi:hypothetical protein
VRPTSYACLQCSVILVQHTCASVCVANLVSRSCIYEPQPSGFQVMYLWTTPYGFQVMYLWTTTIWFPGHLWTTTICQYVAKGGDIILVYTRNRMQNPHIKHNHMVSRSCIYEPQPSGFQVMYLWTTTIWFPGHVSMNHNHCNSHVSTSLLYGILNLLHGFDMVTWGPVTHF